MHKLILVIAFSIGSVRFCLGQDSVKTLSKNGISAFSGQLPLNDEKMVMKITGVNSNMPVAREYSYDRMPGTENIDRKEAVKSADSFPKDWKPLSYPPKMEIRPGSKGLIPSDQKSFEHLPVEKEK